MNINPTDKQRIICFLCGAPRYRWEMVLELNQHICRCCVNYEGSRLLMAIQRSLEGLCRQRTRRNMKCLCDSMMGMNGIRVICCQTPSIPHVAQSNRRPRSTVAVDTANSNGVLDLSQVTANRTASVSNTQSVNVSLRNILSMPTGIAVPVVTGVRGPSPPLLTPVTHQTTTITRADVSNSDSTSGTFKLPALRRN